MLQLAKYALVLLMLGLSTVAHAASVCVSVTDLVKLPLPRSKVVIVDLATQEIHRGETNQSGLFKESELREGAYSVEAGWLAGFLTVRLLPIKVGGSSCKEVSIALPFSEIDQYAVMPHSLLIERIAKETRPTSAKTPNHANDWATIRPAKSCVAWRNFFLVDFSENVFDMDFVAVESRSRRLSHTSKSQNAGLESRMSNIMLGEK